MRSQPGPTRDEVWQNGARLYLDTQVDQLEVVNPAGLTTQGPELWTLSRVSIIK